MDYTVKRSFSYAKIQQASSYSVNRNSKARGSERTMVATMNIMRYYHSVREELSAISEDALTLLDQQDYIGFFKSCGPNYIRGLRRAQELTAIFSFKSTSKF